MVTCKLTFKSSSSCATSGDICTQLHELESTNDVSKSKNSPINAKSFLTNHDAALMGLAVPKFGNTMCTF